LQAQFYVDMIEVCCAIIIQESKLLAVQRGPESNHPWKWEFPGGKINPLETPEQCIVREIQEELIVNIEVVNHLLPIEFDYGKQPLRLIPLVCNISTGEIQLTEHAAMQWIDFDQCENLDWSEADRLLIMKNSKQLKLLLS